MKYVTKIKKPSSNANVGKRIEYARRNLLMNQEQLADMIGRQRPEITMFENGTRTPDIFTLKDIAKALNVSSDYLLGLNECESADIDSIAINKLTGLSDKAIEVLICLNKHSGKYILPTINFLLEQEQLPVLSSLFEIQLVEDSEHINNSNISKTEKEKRLDILNQNYQRAINELQAMDYKPTIELINDYFNIKINKDDETYINYNSISKNKNILTKRIITSDTLINSVYLEEIQALLKEAKNKYVNDNVGGNV